MAQLDKVAPLFKDLAKVEHDHKVACQECALYKPCLLLGLHSNDLVELDKIIQRSQTYSCGSLYSATKQNSIPSSLCAPDRSKPQCRRMMGVNTRFYFPGEFIGMDAIYEQAYKSTAKALESSTVCELPFKKLQEFSATMPQLQMQMMSRLSKELSGEKTGAALGDVIDSKVLPPTLSLQHHLFCITSPSPESLFLSADRTD